MKSGEGEARDLVQRRVGGKKSGLLRDAAHERISDWSVDGQAADAGLGRETDPDIANVEADRALQENKR